MSFSRRVPIALTLLLSGAVSLVAWRFGPAWIGAAQHVLSDHYLNNGIQAATVGRINEGIENMDKAIRLDPMSVQAYDVRAQLHRDLGDYQKAIADCDKSISLAPSNDRAYVFRGGTFYKLGDYDKAIADYSEALHIDPRIYPVYLMRALAFQDRGDTSKAFADCSEAIRINPDYSHAYINRGDLYYKQGDLDKALADYNKTLRIDPINSTALLNRANLFKAMGDYAHASDDFRSIPRVDEMPDLDHDISGLNKCAWFLATCPDPAYRDGKQAVIRALSACRYTQWESTPCIDTLAAAYAETGDFEKATNYAEWYLTLKPDDKDAEARLELYKAHKPYRETPKLPGS